MKRFTGKTFPLLVAAVVAGGFVMAQPMAAEAATVDMQAGTPAFTLGTTSATPTVVGFGGKQWDVIGYNGGINSGQGVASTTDNTQNGAN